MTKGIKLKQLNTHRFPVISMIKECSSRSKDSTVSHILTFVLEH